MSVNRYTPHLLILPEDQANADLADGFVLHHRIDERAVQVLPYVGGWMAVVEKFQSNHISNMRRHPKRRFVLLIDFDQDEGRLMYVRRQIPQDVKERVFVLGSFSNPEELRRDLGQTLESIGESLSTDCVENRDDLWKHELLRHNLIELNRMITDVKPFLFGN